MHYITHSEQETKELGKKIALNLEGGDIVCLLGELGAGKTTFVKGIAEGFGIKEEITSPTFTLMNIYPITSPLSRFASSKSSPDRSRGSSIFGESGSGQALTHIDTYRLKNEQELLDIGVEDYLGQKDTITIIEWPEKIMGLLQNKKTKKITIKHQANNQRSITYED